MKYTLHIYIVCILLLGLSSCLIPPAITATITHTTITSPNSGAINVNLNGNTATGYQWSNGGTTMNLSGLQASNTPYNLTVAGSLNLGSGNYLPFNYPVLSKYVLCDVSWVPVTNSSPNINLSGAPFAHGSVGKSTIGATNAFNASAYSVNVLPANSDGRLEFQIGGYGDFFIGLTPQYTSDMPTSIYYGLYFRTRRQMQGFGNGSSAIYEVYAQNNTNNTTAYIGTYRVGDIFDIIKSGNTLQFKQNNQPCNVTFSIATSSNLIVDLSAKGVGMSLTYARTSFSDAPDYKNFAALKKDLDATYVVMYNNIYIKYNEKYYNPALQYSIYDWKRSAVLTSSVSNVFNGNNFLILNPLATLQDSQMYVLEVTNSKGEVYKLRFQYKKSQ